MKNTRILVTGAAGKTGAAVVEQLLERGFPVRALVRRNDERSTRLETLGAEVAVGDLHDLKSMRAAMQGVKLTSAYRPKVSTTPRVMSRPNGGVPLGPKTAWITTDSPLLAGVLGICVMKLQLPAFGVRKTGTKGRARST